MFFINLVGKDNFYLELQPAIKHDKSNADAKTKVTRFLFTFS